MPRLPKPGRPLKILTIDGGGLQAIASLLILDDLLEKIKQGNQASEKPRPCQVFDMIAGTGAGGWLALLLGRFCLDIPTCLMEWNTLTGCIAPHSRIEDTRTIFHGSKLRFDTSELVEQIKELTQVYGTGDTLLDDDPPLSIRSKYVFVAALRADKKHEYNLFRSYSYPKDLEKDLLPGPRDPRDYEIWRAFAATGAARYFSPPWKEDFAGGGKRQYQDKSYPKPHNITELALNEAWTLFGKDVAMSVVVNIGPGLPVESDLDLIARSFSFGLSELPLGSARRRRRRLQQSEAQPGGDPDDENFKSPARVNTRGSLADITPAKKAARCEEDIEQSIKQKLSHVYRGVGSRPPYYRLAPKHSPPGSFRNDMKRPQASSDSVERWKRSDNNRLMMDDAASCFDGNDYSSQIAAANSQAREDGNAS